MSSLCVAATVTSPPARMTALPATPASTFERRVATTSEMLTAATPPEADPARPKKESLAWPVTATLRPACSCAPTPMPLVVPDGVAAVSNSSETNEEFGAASPTAPDASARCGLIRLVVLSPEPDCAPSRIVV